jgi:hypothetical protein
MGPPQLQSGGVDTWFSAALDAAKAVIAGECSMASSHHDMQHSITHHALRPDIAEDKSQPHFGAG